MLVGELILVYLKRVGVDLGTVLVMDLRYEEIGVLGCFGAIITGDILTWDNKLASFQERDKG